MAKLNQALQPTLNEMFFTQHLVLVEGLEDIAYIHAWLAINDLWDDYRSTGCHIVQTSGKNHMIRPALIAQGLGIPVFAIFDGDGDKISKPEHKVKHEADNKALFHLFGGDAANLFPSTTLWGAQFVVWSTDIGKTVDEEFLASLGEAVWGQVRNQALAEYGNEGGLAKNALQVGTKLRLAKEQGGKSPSLDKLCAEILKFGSA